MLTRYMTLKKSIADSNRRIDQLRTSVHDSETVVGQLQTHLRDLLNSNESEIERECEKMLNRELTKVKEFYREELAMVTRFKEKEMAKLNTHKFNLRNNANMEAKDFNDRFNQLKETYAMISDNVLRYMTESDLEAYSKVDFGIDLINESPEKLSKQLAYFENFKEYDMLVSGVGGIESKVDEMSKEVLFGAVAVILVMLISFKIIVVIPYLLFILSTLFIRMRDYYNLIRLIDAYYLLGELKEETLSYYHEQVDAQLLAEDERIRKCVLLLDQVCDELNKNIESVMEEKLQKHRDEFNYDKARKLAESSVITSTSKVEETLKQEEEKVESLKESLEDAILSRNALTEELQNLKAEIKSVYEELKPSFKEKILLSEFFLGFDKYDEPVTFNYKKKATLILFEGDTDGQVDAVMSTLKMMCSQIMCSMYPLAYNITVVDTLTGGAPLSAFRSASEDVDTDSGSTLFNVVSTQNNVDHYINDLYSVFEKRRLQVLSKYKDITEYNMEKMKYKARTLPYLISFFYHFDYAILNKNEKLQQICRLSNDLGIIPIFFVDISKIGEDIKTDKETKKFNYKPEILEDNIDIFTDNIFGFSIDDVVEIIKYSTSDVVSILHTT